MFLMEYFCLYDILPFSKSYPEIESTRATAKCRGRKSFDTWHYIVTCATTLCVSFSSKSKAFNVFQNIFWNQKHVTINSSKEEITCHVIVFCAAFPKIFWSKLKARGGVNLKNRHLSWLYCTVVGLSEAATEVLYKK